MGAFDFLLRKKKPEDGNDLEKVMVAEQQPNFLQQFLPDDPEKKGALARSLLQAGAGMLVTGGPSATPTNLMQVLGKGIGTGVGSYNEETLNNKKLAASGAENRNASVKLQMAQDNQRRAQTFTEKYGAPGVDGYSQEALAELLEIQMQNGDEAGARDTLGMIQQLQQTGAKNGMVVGDDGSYRLADGYAGGLFNTKKAESLGNAIGQNAQTTADMKNFDAGVDNPAFRAYETDQKKAAVPQPESKFLAASGEAAAKRFAQYQEDGLAAKQLTANVGQLAKMSADIGTGKWAEIKKNYGPLAASLGLEVDKLDEIQAFDSMASRIAPGMRVPGSGASSDKDVDMFLRAIPKLGNTPEGNKIISDTLSKVENVKIQAANLATRAQNPNDEFYGKYAEVEKAINALPNPFSEFQKAQAEAASTKTSAAPKTGRVAAVPVVASEDAYNALPSGSAYRFDSDGADVVRRKK